MKYAYITDVQLSNVKLEMSQKYAQYINALLNIMISTFELFSIKYFLNINAYIQSFSKNGVVISKISFSCTYCHSSYTYSMGCSLLWKPMYRGKSKLFVQE